MVINEVAYPKVNLHLAVGAKRPDGYHEIASVFQLVKDSDFKDSVCVRIVESDFVHINVTGLEEIADSKNNTVYKAAELFIRQTGINVDVGISVVKNIPVQSGLGGGSSDAAAVLHALNKYHEISESDLMSIALQVGSDVPFFLSGFTAAVVTGRGDKLYPLKPKNLKITLYPNKNEKMSTAKAYALLDGRSRTEKLQSVEELAKMYCGPCEEWKFYNDFEAVNVSCPDPEYKLTGSGTCRYTIDLLDSYR